MYFYETVECGDRMFELCVAQNMHMATVVFHFTLNQQHMASWEGKLWLHDGKVEARFENATPDDVPVKDVREAYNQLWATFTLHHRRQEKRSAQERSRRAPMVLQPRIFDV